MGSGGLKLVKGMIVLAMTDIVFVFIFLPASLFTAAFKQNLQKYVLLLLSLFYYACGSPGHFVLLLGLLILNISLAYGIDRSKKGKKWARGVLILGILLNIGTLFYYKYFDFFITGLKQGADTSVTAKEILLPMGISFFTFKAISLLVDVYKGTVVLKKNPVYAALYLSFFGQIVSGPICRYHEFYKQARTGKGAKKVWEMFSEGGYLFVKGFLKKVFFANILSLVVVEVFSMDLGQSSASLLWLGAICYSLQLYYDFSGYSDMAIGVGQMYGISCPKNFDYPYVTKSVSEFWRRWHITLGTWFRDYVYIPLGGSRVDSPIRLYFNLFVVWMLTGIWHGSKGTFLFWGFGYFVAIAIEKTFGIPDKWNSRWSKGIYRILVLTFINFQWVIFNSRDLFTGLRYIKHMFVGYGNELADHRTLILLKEYGIIIVFAIIFTMPVVPYVREHVLSKWDKKQVSGVITGLMMGILFVIALSFVVAGQNNPFLYGNF